MFNLPLTSLKSPRLLLRPPSLKDAEPIFLSYGQDPQVTKYLTWKPHASIAVTRTFLQSCLDLWAQGKDLTFIIELISTHQIIGQLHLIDNGHTATIGYLLAQKFWNQGYTTEAVKTASDYIFSHPQFQEIQITCDIDNLASARVAQKAGFTFKTILQKFVLHPNLSDEPRDVKLFTLTRVFN